MLDTEFGRYKVPMLATPIEEMGATHMIDKKLITPPVVNFLKLFKDKAKLVNLPGDRSLGFGSLLEVNEVPLSRRTNQQGGFEFMLNPDNVKANKIWASNPKVLEIIRKYAEQASGQVKNPKTGEILEPGVDVYGVYQNMGGSSNDYSTQVSDTILALMDGFKVSKNSKKILDEEMATMISDWPGINSPKIRSYLNKKAIYNADGKKLKDGGGEARKTLAYVLDKAKYRDLGFPDVPSIRSATSHMDFFGTGSGDQAGKVMARIDVNRKPELITDKTHETYESALFGDEVSQFKKPIKASDIYTDGLKIRRNEGFPIGGDRRFMETKRMVQPVNQEFIDRMGALGLLT
tara:strand:- start:76 stop:1119 length:1044 start_codon:yes stop_codon:yes gene_type:complete